MPAPILNSQNEYQHHHHQQRYGRLLKFTNCSALRPDGSVSHSFSLLVDPESGKIVDGQSAFFSGQSTFTEVIDLGGNLLSPGFIDVQINGAFGVDFSEFDDPKSFVNRLDHFASNIVSTGVTSFVPTIITQKPEVYRKVSKDCILQVKSAANKVCSPQILPLLSPRSKHGQAHSLGWHVEGPFLSPCKKGAHCSSLIRPAPNGIADFEEVYGSDHDGLDMDAPAVKIITLAPEMEGVLDAIPELTQRGCTVSIGHTSSGIDTAMAAKESGATLITHLFNAMGSFNHRDPGVIGLLGEQERAEEGKRPRPYYGLIADGFHSHPCSVRMAYSCHPEGCVLTTDAMPWMDPALPDGTYPWREGQNVTKQGFKVTLEGTDTLAGSVVTMSSCVAALSTYASIPLHAAAKCASFNPAAMLGIQDRKGTLDAGADADLVVLDPRTGDVKQTWIMGKKVFDASNK